MGRERGGAARRRGLFWGGVGARRCVRTWEGGNGPSNRRRGSAGLLSTEGVRRGIRTAPRQGLGRVRALLAIA